MIQTTTSAGIAQNPLLSEAAYSHAINYATKICREDKLNINPFDIVHDLIVSGCINDGNFKKKILCKILRSKEGITTLQLNTLDYKKTASKHDEYFVCCRCKESLPSMLQRRYYSSDGYFVKRNICLQCMQNQNNEYRRKRRERDVGYRDKMREQTKRYYIKHGDSIRRKRMEKYYENKKIATCSSGSF